MSIPSHATSAARSQGGFTLLELMITVAILMPILGVVMSSSDVALNSMRASEAGADAAENVQRIGQRVAQMIRPAVLSTYRMEATQADVDADLADAVGDWIDPVDLEPRTVIQFQSALGVLSMNATSLTSPRELRFRRDASETANSADDDGDGLIDEGSIVMLYDGTEVVLGTGIELCTFTIDSQKITLRMRAGKRRGDGNITRATTIQSLTLRNN